MIKCSLAAQNLYELAVDKVAKTAHSAAPVNTFRGA